PFECFHLEPRGAPANGGQGALRLPLRTKPLREQPLHCRLLAATQRREGTNSFLFRAWADGRVALFVRRNPWFLPRTPPVDSRGDRDMEPAPGAAVHGATPDAEAERGPDQPDPVQVPAAGGRVCDCHPKSVARAGRGEERVTRHARLRSRARLRCFPWARAAH